jgi:hypothetical protein
MRVCKHSRPTTASVAVRPREGATRGHVWRAVDDSGHVPRTPSSDRTSRTSGAFHARLYTSRMMSAARASASAARLPLSSASRRESSTPRSSCHASMNACDMWTCDGIDVGATVHASHGVTGDTAVDKSMRFDQR